MKILSFDITATPGTVAAAIGEKVLAERSLPESPRAAASLAPTLQKLLQELRWRPGDVRLVATTIGPGSFTSVRIAVVTAKTFAYAVRADVLGLNVLDTVAFQTPQLGEYLAVIADAQRGQIVARGYHWEGVNGWRLVAESGLAEPAAWLNDFAAGKHLVVTGPGLQRFADRLANDFVLAPKELWNPRAAAVARLAWKEYQSGRRDDIWSLRPIYYRPSYAEEKRAS